MEAILADQELVAGVQHGDEGSYILLIQRYSDRIFNLAFRLTHNREDAEEVLQDVFVTLYRKLDRFEGKSAFSSWLYRITLNTAFMVLRKRKQSPTISMEDIAPQVRESGSASTSPFANINYITTRHQLRSVLEEAIGSLPDDYRAIFLLRDVDGLSNEEVGDVMGLSVSAVKSRLHRARITLRKRLKRFYQDYTHDDIILYGQEGYKLAA